MRQSRFTAEQIIAILAEQERGMRTAEVCRNHGISPNTFYKWKAKYGGLDISDARKLKSLETENGRLIPTVIDQNPCAHLGMPRDMIFHGWSMRLFQAWQHSATMSS